MGLKTRKQPESQSKNTDGRTSTPLTNLHDELQDERRESSDNEHTSISEDSQEDEALQDTIKNSNQETNLPGTSRVVGRVQQDPARVRTRDTKTVTVDDVTSPKQKLQEKVHQQTLVQQIFTRVFMYQLIIIIACVSLASYILLSYLINSVHKTLEEAEKTLDNMKSDVETLERTISEIERLYVEYKDKVLQLDDIISSKLDVMQQNTFDKDSIIMAFMILMIIVFALAISVYNMYQRQNKVIPGRTGGQGQKTAKQFGNTMGGHDFLRSIPNGPDLEPGVCIISFDEARTETHRRILDSANIANCRVQTYVVRRHEQIPDIPRSTVYLMCTEFSERHVIIEEPGKGLGDLHKTTYDAVLKLGGCLIILYTRDPGSRNLKDQSRYNRNIYCVTHQPELSTLEQDGRFFSVYDNLTAYQRNELRRKIAENMNKD